MKEQVSREKQIVLIDLLDRILYKGVILTGEVTISVANVDLVYLGLKVLLTSVDKMNEMRSLAAQGIMGHVLPAGGGKDAAAK